MRKRRIAAPLSTKICFFHAILLSLCATTVLLLEAYVPPPVLASYRSSATMDLYSSSSAKESSLLMEQSQPSDEGHDDDGDDETHRQQAKMDAANRFHMDMKRVLKTRQDTAREDANVSSSTTTSSTDSALRAYSPMERRNRPTILTQDVDGAIRVISMLRHMVNIDAATEESFQIVLKALCERGRLRWRNRDSVVVCAADEVEPLMDEIWERENGKVSIETCDLVLQAYAACSTPRGDRRYAQKAQDLIDSMIANGISPSTSSYSHVINAWAWQQGNLKGSKCAEMAQSNLDHLMELEPDNEVVLQAMDWVLEAWSKSISSDAPIKAAKLLKRMMDMQKDGEKATMSFPKSHSYANAILAWSKSKEDGAAEKAHHVLSQLLDDYEKGDLPTHVVPDLFAISKSFWLRQLFLNFAF